MRNPSKAHFNHQWRDKHATWYNVLLSGRRQQFESGYIMAAGVALIGVFAIADSHITFDGIVIQLSVEIWYIPTCFTAWNVAHIYSKGNNGVQCMYNHHMLYSRN